MNRVWLAVIGFLLIIPLFSQASAACYTDKQTQYSTRVDTQIAGEARIMTFTPTGGTGRTITYGPAQCGNVPPPSTTVYCDTDTDMYAADSVRAPICGSTPERERANSTCYDCGSGITKCDGLDYALGDTSAFLTDTNNRAPVSPNDTASQMESVWRVQNVPAGSTTFRYNGKDYPVSPTIILCGANNQACGATEACTNLVYGNIDNRGNNPYLSAPSEGQRAARRGPGRQKEILANPGLNVGYPLATNVWLNFLQNFFDTHQIFAWIRYGYNASQQSIFESFPELTRFGPTFEESALDLMTSKHQKEFSPPDKGDKALRYPLEGMAGYRFCAPGAEIEEAGGEDNIPLRGVTASIGNIGTMANPRAWAQLTWASQYFASMTTRAKTEGVDFITPNGRMVDFERKQDGGDVILDVDPEVLDPILFPCDAASAGVLLRRIAKLAEGVSFMGGPGGGLLQTISAKFLMFFFAGALIPCNERDEEGKCKDSRIYILPTDSIAALLANTSQTIGINTGQLSDKMSADDRCKIVNDGGGCCSDGKNINNSCRTDLSQEGQKGGTVRSFLSSAFVKNIDYQNSKMPQHQTFALFNTSGNVPRDAYPLWMRSMVDGLVCMVDNAVVPSALKRSGVRCRYSQGDSEPFPGTADRGIAAWTPSSSLPPDFSSSGFQTSVSEAIQTATDGQIPACVLEGVKFIESGPEWIGGNTCLINQCSAAGPFQITVGQDASGDTHCRGCGPSWADGSRTCPDGWPGNWPAEGNYADSPCNIGPAAKQATKMLIAKSAYWTEQVLGQSRPLNGTDSIESQRDAIMLAGDSYWGKTATIERLGGCTYGEFVYKHCDPSYQCTGNPPVSLP